MDAEYQRISKTLEEQFQAAVKRRDVASARFNEASHPSGLLPHPDGTQRMIKATGEYGEVLRGVTLAVQRIADFKIRNIVPQDLKANEDTREADPVE
jgi:hypothetical protein